MKFLGMGVPELIIILVVILLIFGPKNLPKLGKAFGKTVSNLREGMNEGKKKAVDEKGGAEEQAAEDPADEGPAMLEAAVEDVEDAAESADGEVEDADAPKKVVKKVVRKKVETE